MSKRISQGERFSAVTEDGERFVIVELVHEINLGFAHGDGSDIWLTAQKSYRTARGEPVAQEPDGSFSVRRAAGGRVHAVRARAHGW